MRILNHVLVLFPLISTDWAILFKGKSFSNLVVLGTADKINKLSLFLRSCWVYLDISRIWFETSNERKKKLPDLVGSLGRHYQISSHFIILSKFKGLHTTWFFVALMKYLDLIGKVFSLALADVLVLVRYFCDEATSDIIRHVKSKSCCHCANFLHCSMCFVDFWHAIFNGVFTGKYNFTDT